MQNENLLQKLINTTNVCFLSSVNQDGFPVTRAMSKPIRVEERILYLQTKASSNKVQQFKNNSKACLYFYNAQNFQGITLLGEMEILTDKQDKQEFWKDEYSSYYTKGNAMSDFTVLKFHRID